MQLYRETSEKREQVSPESILVLNLVPSVKAPLALSQYTSKPIAFQGIRSHIERSGDGSISCCLLIGKDFLIILVHSIT